MMKQSSVHQQYQLRCYQASEFDDLQEDFSQFLEEAKQHANEAKLRSSSVHPEQSGSKRSGSEKEKKLKDKKSWKSCLLSWLKADRKSKFHGEPTRNYSESKEGCGRRKQGHVSGQIYKCGNGAEAKQWRPTSMLRSTKREESSDINICIPYVTLQQNSPRAVPVMHNNYGPLYVVT